MNRHQLSELLVRARVATATRVDEALAIIRGSETPVRLVSILLDQGHAREADIARMFAKELTLPWVALAALDVPQPVLSLIPRDTAMRFSMMPVYVRRELRGPPTLFVAIEDPTWEEAIATAAVLAGTPVRPVVAARSEIRAAIVRSYEPKHPEVATQPPAVISAFDECELINYPSQPPPGRRARPSMPAPA